MEYGFTAPTEMLSGLPWIPGARKDGAGDGIRTRDINLGKVALYQLSYSRDLNHSDCLAGLQPVSNYALRLHLKHVSNTLSGKCFASLRTRRKILIQKAIIHVIKPSTR